MDYDVGDMLRALRPFPNDAQASFDVCAELFEMTFEDASALTEDKVEALALEAAKGYQYLAILTKQPEGGTDLDIVAQQWQVIQAGLRKVLPERQMASLHGTGDGKHYTYRVRLYTFEEAPMPPEKEARVSAFLARAGINLDELPGEEKPTLQ